MKKIQALTLFTAGLALGLVPLLASAQSEAARTQMTSASPSNL